MKIQKRGNSKKAKLLNWGEADIFQKHYLELTYFRKRDPKEDCLVLSFRRGMEAIAEVFNEV